MKGIFFFYFLLHFFLIQAQEIKKNIPFSILYNYKELSHNYQTKFLDIKQIMHDDSVQFVKNQQFNVARLQNINFKPLSSSNKKYLSSTKAIWKIKIKVPNARKSALKITKLDLPKGSRLFIYSKNKPSNFLVFDATNIKYKKSNFISKSIEGENLILEYNQFENLSDSAIIDIEGVVNYYKNLNDGVPGFGQSTDCEVNLACSEGDGWCNEAQAVVRILIQSGSKYSYCSGTVVNNTKQDFEPYVLTAEHCGENSNNDDFKYWQFDFNYQSDNCTTPSSESEIISNQLSGCEQIAKARREISSGSDFRLVKLLDSIPRVWNVYFAGWDIKEYNTITGGGVGIHHPYGDIKKISTFMQDLTASDASGGDNNDNFWKTFWVKTQNGYGITEGGSSGSALFNNQGLIIGTLSTGSSFCDNRKTSPDFYGKISRHWDDNGDESQKQLKLWLDPLNSGIEQLGGITNNQNLVCGEKINFKGLTLFPNPAKSILRIGNDNLNYLANATIEIYDLRGVLVFSEKTDASINIKQINISTLPEAVYVLKVVQTGWVTQQKFVILR